MKKLSRILLFSCALWLWPFLATAQVTTVAVDITKAKLTWTWTQGTGGIAAAFRVKCGTIAGTYSILVSLPDPAARSVAVSAVITATGRYFCAVSAANQYGESTNSNEVSFDAGTVPVAPAGFTIQAQ